MKKATIIVHVYRKSLISAQFISYRTNDLGSLYSGGAISFATHQQIVEYISKLAQQNNIEIKSEECFGGVCYTNIIFYDISDSTYEADRYIIPKVRR